MVMVTFADLHDTVAAKEVLPGPERLHSKLAKETGVSRRLATPLLFLRVADGNARPPS